MELFGVGGAGGDRGFGSRSGWVAEAIKHEHVARGAFAKLDIGQGSRMISTLRARPPAFLWTLET